MQSQLNNWRKMGCFPWGTAQGCVDGCAVAMLHWCSCSRQRQPVLLWSFALLLGHLRFHHLSLAVLQNGSFKSHLLSASVDRLQVTSQRMLKRKPCCWMKGKMRMFLANSHRGLLHCILWDTDAIYGTSEELPRSAYSEQHVDRYKTNKTRKFSLWKNWTGKPDSVIARGFLNFWVHRVTHNRETTEQLVAWQAELNQYSWLKIKRTTSYYLKTFKLGNVEALERERLLLRNTVKMGRGRQGPFWSVSSDVM